MASFDVSSLFTNIPLNETIDLYTDLIFDESDSFDFSDCTFKRAEFKKLLCLAVKENHFIFNGSLYDQIDGVAMGSFIHSFIHYHYLYTIPLQLKT